MIIKKLQIEKEACSQCAEEIFLQISGVNRDGRKFERMRREAFRIRAEIDEKIRPRAVCAYVEKPLLLGQEAVIEGHSFLCGAFEQLKKETIKGVYVYGCTAGEFSLPEAPLMDQVYADLWGTAFADALRLFLKKELETESKLSDSFGPGFYGMDVSAVKQIAELLDFDNLEMELRGGKIILPLKSCAGLYFAVTEEYQPLRRECESCLGTYSSCALCQIYERIK